MPKKKTPKAAPQQQDDLSTMFTTIGDPNADMPPAEPPSVEEQIKALADQLKAVQTTVAEVTRRSEDRITNLAMQLLAAQRAPQQSAPAQAQAEPSIDLTGLPDPAADPQGFQKALDERVKRLVQATTAQAVSSIQSQVSTEQDRAKRVEELWRQFKTKYADLAEYEDLVELSANKVAQRAQARGLSPEQFIFADPESFMEDVAKETRDRLAKIRKVEDDDDDQTDNGDDGRTAGIAGGGGVGHIIGRPNPQDKLFENSTLIGELKEVQKKIGLF